MEELHNNKGGPRAPADGPRKSASQSKDNEDKASGREVEPGATASAAAHDGEPPDNPEGERKRPPEQKRHNRSRSNKRHGGPRRPNFDPAANDAEIYGALDLGTNNCRLLLARPSRRGFRVVDAFSRIIRLGEGLSQTGRLSEQAMKRTIDALRVCAAKLERGKVRRARLVATEACRVAQNADEFLIRVKDAVGLDIEILSTEMEARLAVSGCASLIDPNSDLVLVFDIGGGSSELIWLDLTRRTNTRRNGVADRLEAQNCMVAWTSLPVGVVTLAERYGGQYVTAELFEKMVADVSELLAPFEAEHQFAPRLKERPGHLLGASGTVTTVAGIQLGLPRYDRNRVDGSWLNVADAQKITNRLLHQTYDERISEPCIGRDRADLVLAGCAILEAILLMWPCERLRVADRGLREGILATLMSEDGVFRARRRRGGGSKKRDA